MNKKNDAELQQVNSKKPLKEDSNEALNSIRELLFGRQINLIDANLKTNFQQLTDRIDRLESRLDEKVKQIEKSIDVTGQDLSQKMESNQVESASQESILAEAIDQLKSAVAEFQQQTDSEFGSLRNEFHEAAESLNSSLTADIVALSEKIDSRSKELSNNKADRKTLASLLESMAVNLNQN